MLKNYLPILPVKNKILGKIIIPPKSIRTVIDDAYKNRNQIAHGRTNIFKKDFDLEKFLIAVRDVLYFLDFYCRNTWVFNNISVETSSEIVELAKRQ